MEKILKTVINNVWIQVIIFFVFVFFPALPFYKDLVVSIFSGITIHIEFSKNFFDIITGLFLGGMFLLFLRSAKEYIRIKAENIHIRELLLTIHTFDNIRFHKMHQVVPTLFQNEEIELNGQLRDVLKKDLGRDYTDKEIREVLDCFYRGKPKFI